MHPGTLIPFACAPAGCRRSCPGETLPSPCLFHLLLAHHSFPVLLILPFFPFLPVPCVRITARRQPLFVRMILKTRKLRVEHVAHERGGPGYPCGLQTREPGLRQAWSGFNSHPLSPPFLSSAAPAPQSREDGRGRAAPSPDGRVLKTRRGGELLRPDELGSGNGATGSTAGGL
jgi:hypothetical protein